MIKVYLLTAGICLALAAFSQPKSEMGTERQPIRLPNGWSLTPAGHSVSLGDLPLNLVVSPSANFIAATNNGVGEQSIELFDVKGEKITDSISIPKSWYGLAFLDDKTLFASGGNDNCIREYKIVGDKLKLSDSVLLGRPWPVKISPAGITIDPVKKIVYVVTRENNSLYIIDLATKATLKQVSLGAEGYTCLLSPDRSLLYVSEWGAGAVAMVDTKSMTMTATIPVGNNPNEMVLAKNGRYLYVANSGDNSVSVIDVIGKKVIETLNAALYPNSLVGSTTNGVALSHDGKKLYIANADNNCLAVFEVGTPGSSVSKGFIPVGWYPTNVKVIGKKIFVTNGKGFSSLPDPNGPNPVNPGANATFQKSAAGGPQKEQYIGSLFTGTLSIVDEPGDNLLAVYSKQVYANTPYRKQMEGVAEGEPGNPVPQKTGGESPIKHVFYILKENRTYDQVLGDMPKGNGDTSLVLFGMNITPNQHALADRFVLLDNFFVDGEVSADGHNWSMSAYANDYNEKTWPTSYGGRGGTYDYSGNRAIGLSPNGYIWDDCIRHHVTMRNYGEFADDGEVHLKGLEQKTCFTFPHWDLKIQDIYREKIWEKDFDSLVALGQLPSFNIVYFPNDHTSGQSIGAFTPIAAVADNDLAVGRFVEHLSHSAVWNQSAVFILEDDAQDGADHVDAHRSPAFVISPFVKKSFVDHTAYTTSSMLRTMELILGLPPMSQYDAAATPFWRCFTARGDETPFISLLPQVDLDQRNTKLTASARKSMALDLSKEDKSSPSLLNEVIWKSVKGEDAVMAPPKHSAFLKVNKGEEKD
ncbi:MAG TPA: bifunctional YncE family protein/alkaline phosphatase family protein [Puia sp.]|nr:bifunctional YncE family protein/alkaline phosphatase family protein [Puia sp.]